MIMIIKSAKIIRESFLSNKGSQLTFCTGKDEMKLLRDKALLASNIIKRIRSQNTIDELSHLPLSESIIKYLESVKDVEEGARQEMLDNFKNGFKYNQKVWSQKRFVTVAFQNWSKLKLYPTNFVTGQLFKRFFDQKYRCSLKTSIYTGTLGVSSSFSTMVFANLSNMIAEYNFKNWPKKQYENENSGIINSPKVFYYNDIQRCLQFTPSQIWRNLLLQISPEISSTQQNNCLKFDVLQAKLNKNELSTKIKDEYNKRGVEVILFCDQISEYFQLLKQFEEFMADPLFNYDQDQVWKSFIDGKKQQIYSAKKHLREFHQNFNQTVYLGSMDMERDFIDKSGLHKQNLKIEQHKIPYVQHLHTDKYMSEIIDVFLFVLGSTFNLKLLQQYPYYEESNGLKKVTFKQSIRQTLFKELQKIRFEYFLNFIFIHYSIKQQLKSQTSSKQKERSQFYDELNSYDEKQLEELIIQWFKKAIKFSQKKLESYFYNFVQKQKISTNSFYQLAFELHIAIDADEKTGEIGVGYEINIEKYSKELKELVERALSRQFFSFEKNILKFKVAPKIIMKILSSYIRKTPYYILHDNVNFLCNILKKTDLDDSFGLIFLKAILVGNKKILLFQQERDPILTISNISTRKSQFIYIPEDQRKNKEKNYKFLNGFKNQLALQIKKMQISQTTYKSFIFSPIDKGQIPIQSLRQQINLLESKKNKMEPNEVQTLQKFQEILKAKQNMEENQFSNAKRIIGLMIVEIVRGQTLNQLKIHGLNMTIFQGQEFSKLSTFIKEFSTFADANSNELTIQNQKYQVSLNYFVLSPIPPSYQITDSLNEQFKNSFEFSQAPSLIAGKPSQKHYLEVKSKKDINCILKNVGCFDIYNDLRVYHQKLSIKQEQQSYKKFQLWRYLQNHLKKEHQTKTQNDILIQKLDQILNTYSKDQDQIKQIIQVGASLKNID